MFRKKPTRPGQPTSAQETQPLLDDAEAIAIDSGKKEAEAPLQLHRKYLVVENQYIPRDVVSLIGANLSARDYSSLLQANYSFHRILTSKYHTDHLYVSFKTCEDVSYSELKQMVERKFPEIRKHEDISGKLYGKMYKWRSLHKNLEYIASGADAPSSFLVFGVPTALGILTAISHTREYLHSNQANTWSTAAIIGTLTGAAVVGGIVGYAVPSSVVYGGIRLSDARAKSFQRQWAAELRRFDKDPKIRKEREVHGFFEFDKNRLLERKLHPKRVTATPGMGMT